MNKISADSIEKNGMPEILAHTETLRDSVVFEITKELQ